MSDTPRNLAPESVRAFLRSHTGRVRRANEDRCAVASAQASPVDWTGKLASDGGWALIADGVGGHVAGHIAASLAIEVLRPLMPHVRTAADVHRAVNLADEAIFMAMDMRPELRGMATTITGVVLREDSALAFNAGDSRVYAFENGKLEQISTDDSMKSGALLQCLGGYQEPVPLYVHSCPIASAADILLCSDGLSGMVSDHDIAELLRSRPANPAAELVDLALTAGGEDNVSVVVISSRA